MTLSYLDFDFSEDTSGHASFDAMASARPRQLASLMAEVSGVLAWAHREFGPPGSPEGDALWDYALQASQEVVTALDARYDARHERVEMAAASGAGEARTTLSLTLSGTAAFAESFRQAFASPDAPWD